MSVGTYYQYNPAPRDIPRRHEQQAIQTISQTGLSVSLEEIKEDLRIRHSELDKHLLGEIDAAVNAIELSVFRTVRPSATYRMTDRLWPTSRHYTPNAFWWWWPSSFPRGQMYFFMPPLVTVDAVRYVDGTTRTATFSGVDGGTDVVTLTASPSWLDTGLLATYAATSADTGLTDGNDYYIREVSANTITLHTTLADALANTNIVDLSADGTTETLATGEQVLAATNYNVVLSTKSRSFMEFNDTFDAPVLDDVPDAIIYDYTCGYSTRQAIPATLQKSIASYVAYLVDGSEDDYEASQRLLLLNEWGSYS